MPREHQFEVKGSNYRTGIPTVLAGVTGDVYVETTATVVRALTVSDATCQSDLSITARLVNLSEAGLVRVKEGDQAGTSGAIRIVVDQLAPGPADEQVPDAAVLQDHGRRRRCGPERLARPGLPFAGSVHCRLFECRNLSDRFTDSSPRGAACRQARRLRATTRGLKLLVG